MKIETVTVSMIKYAPGSLPGSWGDPYLLDYENLIWITGVPQCSNESSIQIQDALHNILDTVARTWQR
ncbi:MAG: hypothetical protein GY906_24755 [bacterium]|nr:hypothetical protein [bacterium]